MKKLMKRTLKYVKTKRKLKKEVMLKLIKIF